MTIMNLPLLRRAAMAIACASTALLASCASSSSSSSGRGAFLEKTWATPEFQKTNVQQKYSSVYIAPVDTSRLAKQDWWQNQNSRVQAGVLEKDARKLGRQLQSSLTREIRSYPGNKLAIASGPGPHTLTIETAITAAPPAGLRSENQCPADCSAALPDPWFIGASPVAAIHRIVLSSCSRSGKAGKSDTAANHQHPKRIDVGYERRDRRGDGQNRCRP